MKLKKEKKRIWHDEKYNIYKSYCFVYFDPDYLLLV